ncbi:MAG: DNA polymerase III subunit delta [Candidatus Polarisedimenticolaceae bacterium]|nr:DNA polymerase III subunit delta [Candidatus Polarisedimenticolaceae bacterium]
MRVRSDQLAGQLSRSLVPVYLISGDEPLQLGEAADAVRQAAKTQGYSDRLVMDHGTGFNWDELAAISAEMSLFSERRVIDLRLSTAKIGTDGSKALAAYAENPSADDLLLISCPKLEKAQQNAKWVKAIERVGVLVQVWPIDVAQLPRWIEQRLRSRGLNPEREVASMLAERVEGNLLAAAQEVEKLLLLNGPGAVTIEQMLSAVADSARFDVYGLVDAALQGNIARVTRMLDGLRGEGLAAPVVLWALAREIRMLCGMRFAIDSGEPAERVMANHRVWDKRKPLVKKGLQRFSLQRWQRLLQQCGQADRLIKGQARGDPWQSLISIASQMAGAKPLVV